jgi:PAS domain S-box-containing protein
LQIESPLLGTGGFMENKLRILILEDSPADAELEENELIKSGLIFASKVVDTKEAFLKALDEFLPNLILSDYELPSFNGLAALKIAKEKCPDVPFILVTGKLGEEFVIETLKKGLTDYVLKGNIKRLVPVIHRALKETIDYEKLKKAQSDLLFSEKRYRRLFETAKDGIILLNAETGQIEDINPYLLEMLGYSHGEFLEKKLWEIGPFKNIQETKKLFVDLQEKKHIRYEHLPLETKDGKHIHVEFVSNVYSVDHTRIIQCNIRNITERKKIEDDIKKRVKELEDFYDIAIGRELKMIELKEEIEALKEELGKYKNL